jgi:hypothetical protein
MDFQEVMMAFLAHFLSEMMMAVEEIEVFALDLTDSSIGVNKYKQLS